MTRRAPIALATVLLVLLGAAPARADWVWPVQGEVITPYRNGDDPYAAGQHRGIDIAAAIGTIVVAAAGGEVRFAGPAGSSGLTVSIRTVDGLLDTSYLHLSATAVRKGQAVATGDPLGAVGTSGVRSAQQPHLHFGVREAGSRHAYRDPLAFLPPPGFASPRPRPSPVPNPAPEPLAPEPGRVPASRPAPVPRHTPLPVPLPHRAPQPAPQPHRAPQPAPLPHRAPQPAPVAHGAPHPAPLPRTAPRRAPASHGSPLSVPREVSALSAPAGAARRHVRPAPHGAPGGRPAMRGSPGASARPEGRVAARGALPANTRAAVAGRASDQPAGPDLGWAVACLGLLAAAALVGLTEDGREATRRSRKRVAGVLRPLSGRR